MVCNFHTDVIAAVSVVRGVCIACFVLHAAYLLHCPAMSLIISGTESLIVSLHLQGLCTHGRSDRKCSCVSCLLTSYILNAEKNLKALKTIMASLPSATCLAFVGDGPEKAALQQHYSDMSNVKFMVRSTATLCKLNT